MGWVRARRRLPSRRARLVVAVLCVILVATTLAAVSLTHVVETAVTGSLRQARADLERGAAHLENGYRSQDPAELRAAAASFDRAKLRLDALGQEMRSADVARGSAVPAPLRDRLMTLDAIIDVAEHVDQAGTAAAGALLTAGLAGRGPGAGEAGPSELIARLSVVRDELDAAGRAAGSIDLTVLPSSEQAPLRTALDELHVATSGLDALWPSIGAVLDVLGLDGPRTYLIEQVNPAELRSGGGFIGTVSLVHADHGRVSLARSLPVEAFDYCDAAGCAHPRPQPWQPGYVAPPAELAGPPLPFISRLSAWSLEDSGFYPDFATNATVAEAFARRLLGTPVDGTIAIDYDAVAPLLQLTGPISLPEYHLTLTAANFVDTVVGLDLARDYAHKDVISAAAAQIVAHLSRLPPGDLPNLFRIVQVMVRGRHLQLHFDSPSVERESARLGATDVLNPESASDFLLETEDNYGGSKANYFLQRRFRLDLTRSGDLLEHRLTIDLHDGAPADRPFIGPHYYAYLRITVPANAARVTVTSAAAAEYAPIQAPARRTQEPPSGAKVAGGWIFVQVGDGLSGDYQATFAWETPWPAARSSAVLYWQKQPGTGQDPVQVTWTSGAGTYSVGGDLREDQVVTAAADRVSMRAAGHS